MGIVHKCIRTMGKQWRKMRWLFAKNKVGLYARIVKLTAGCQNSWDLGLNCCYRLVNWVESDYKHYILTDITIAVWDNLEDILEKCLCWFTLLIEEFRKAIWVGISIKEYFCGLRYFIQNLTMFPHKNNLLSPNWLNM